MLATQVEYWKLQETNRHNLIAEEQGWASINETHRHNVVTEQQGWYGAETERMKADELHRHNVASEQFEQQKIDLSRVSLAENARHNKATEGIGYAQVAEQARHNIEQENLQWKNNAVASYDANTKRMQMENQQEYWDRMATATEQNVINQFIGSTPSQQQAQASQERAATEQQRQELEEDRFKHQMTYDWASLAERSAEDTSKELRSWFSAFTSPGD